MVCPHASTIKGLTPPSQHSKVHKEECTLCFDNEDGPEGIDVCLRCFTGCCTGAKPELGGLSHAALHYQKSKHSLFVNIKRIKKAGRESSSPPKKITKLAIEAEREEDMYDFVPCLKCYECGGVPVETVPSEVAIVIDSILAALSAKKQSEIKAWSEEITACTHTQTLEQGDKKDLGTHALAHCNKCDIHENLWLCLTCGNLGCGRKQFGGLGGNGHGIEHYEATHHPISVKIGTITPEGTADIFCYLCGEERLDPLLGTHLHHFGIKISDQQKTAKSITELQLEQNLKFDFSMTTEDGKTFDPLFGAGLTGLKNLGNTCYMASVLQILFSIDEMKQRYLPLFGTHVKTCSTSSADCFHCQMSKLAYGMLSGNYSQAPASDAASAESGQDGISPAMFKDLIGRGHFEFSTMRQQDAQDFLTHLLSTMEQKERALSGSSSQQDPSTVFQLAMEQKLQCVECHGVRYSQAKENCLHLFIPAKKIEGGDMMEGEQWESISLEKCLQHYFDGSVGEGWSCPKDKKKTNVVRSSKLYSCPSVLTLVMKRFVMGENYVMKKLNVAINAPAELSLESFIAPSALPEGEEALPEASSGSGLPTFNQAALDQLLQMGFPEIRCQKALLATGNSDAEAAMSWLFEHMEDPDIDAPIESVKKPADASAAESTFSQEHIGSLMDMGFTLNQAKKALKETSGSMERAVDWLFSHSDDQGEDIDMADASGTGNEASAGAARTVDSKPCKYKLVGFISHKGTSTSCGHYVAHVLHQGKWVLFNDNKVAHVPEQEIKKAIEDAYVYFYRRTI